MICSGVKFFLTIYSPFVVLSGKHCIWTRFLGGKPLTLDDLVFCNHEGSTLDPTVLSYDFARIIKRAGPGHVHFHDLWHTFIRQLLLRGAKSKVNSEVLGRASVAFTMNVYSHIIEGMRSDVMVLLDEVLPAGVSLIINAKLMPKVGITANA